MTFAISNQVVLSSEPEGPLARHIASFADSLDAMGYAAGSIHRQVQICACFSQWLGQREVTPQDITPGHLTRYLRYRARRCRPCLGDAAALMHLVDFLRGKGVISPKRVYLDASLAMKEQALAKTTPLLGRPGRYRPGDRLMEFLNGL